MCQKYWIFVSVFINRCKINRKTFKSRKWHLRAIKIFRRGFKMLGSRVRVSKGNRMSTLSFWERIKTLEGMLDKP